MDGAKIMYIFKSFYIEDDMLESLEQYVEKHRPVGSFLKAVLCNDLKQAVQLADQRNIGNLPAYVSWLYNNAPIGCYGSVEEYNEWIL